MTQITVRRRGKNNRRGAIVVLLAVLLTMLFAFAAFTVDVGHMTVAVAELQNASDAAAISGAAHLRDGSAQARSYAISLAAQNNAAIPVSDAGIAPYNAGTGEFKLSGGDHVTLPPGIYYFSKLTLSGGSLITVTGATVMYCVGDFVASGSSIANTSQNPTNLQVFCTGGKVDISGGSDFYGVVYAPNSKVVRSSGSNHVYGSLMGKELTLSGGGGAHADTALGAQNGTSAAVALVE